LTQNISKSFLIDTAWNEHTNVGVVREIEVERLIKREGSGVVVEGKVDLSSGLCDQLVLKSGVQLLNVTDSNSTASGRLEHVVTSEGQINAVLVTV
jgi:hypothetical protein